MGDRANVVIKSSGQQVCLYTHWTGSELPEIVKEALKRGKNRWDDFQYLTRIIFCEMIKDDVMGETGYGISQEEHDGGGIVNINCDEGTIAIDSGEPVSFNDYINS